MTHADQHRQRIADAIRAHGLERPAPTISVVSAARIDSACPYCGGVSGVAIRWRHRRCEGAHGAIACACCSSIADAGGGRCGDLLTLEDRALLRQAAHRIGRLRGVA